MYSLYRDVVVYSKACGFDHTDIHDYAQSTKVCVVMDFKTCKQKQTKIYLPLHMWCSAIFDLWYHTEREENE